MMSNDNSPESGRNHIDQMQQLSQKQLGEALVEHGYVRFLDLRKAQTLQNQHGGEIIEVLIRLGCLDIQDFMAFLIQQPMIHVVDLSDYEMAPELLQLVPAEFAIANEVVPIGLEDDTLLLGVKYPVEETVLKALREHTGLGVKPVLCAESDIVHALERYYTVPAADESGKPASPERASNIIPLEGSMRLRQVARLISGIETLPGLPETVYRVRQAMNDPATSIGAVAEVVILDPSVAAKVLSVANSASYGFPRRIDDVQLAISLLGLHETYAIVLSISVISLFENSQAMDYRRFWVEALTCGAGVRIAAKASGRRKLDGLFAAGLLHDIGRVALAEVAPGQYGKLEAALEGNALLSAESMKLGITHTEAGHLLAEHWNLPEDLQAAIRYHHVPESAPREHQDLVALVALADAMARSKGRNLDECKAVLVEQEHVLQLLGLDMENAEAMLDEFLSLRGETLGDAIL